MAKSKRTPALFEVIRNDKAAGDGARPLLRVPRLWTRRKATSAPGFAVVEPSVPVAAAAAAPRMSMAELSHSIADPTRPAAGGGPAFHFGFDGDRQELIVRMRFTTAVVSAFSVIVLIGLAYVTGRQGARAPASLAAVSSEELQKGPIHAGVLDVGPGSAAAGGRAAVTEVARNTGAAAAATADRLAPRPAAPTAARPGTAAAATATSAIVDVNSRRSIGLNYVIIQSYPDQKAAADAAAFLNKNGVACTVEQAPAGWTKNPNWFSVVGVAGFQRIRNSQEFDSYVRTIQRAGDIFAGNSRSKRFQPQPYRWRDRA